MHSNAGFHDGLDLQAHGHEEDVGFQARCESELHDRTIVRQELDRGVPEAEIEEHLELASDFVRLNPGADARAYVRRLIEEEKGDFHALSDAQEPFRDGLPPAADSNGGERPERAQAATPRSGEQAQQEIAAPPGKSFLTPAPRPPNPKTAEAEAMAREYVNANFEAGDWLAVVAVNRKSGEIT
jgi:hypothetical protein